MDKYLKIDIKPWERRWPGLIGILKAYLPCSCTGQMWIKIFAGGFFFWKERKKGKKRERKQFLKITNRFTFLSLFLSLLLTLYNLLSIYTCFKAYSSNLRFTLKFERNRQDLDYPRFYQPCQKFQYCSRGACRFGLVEAQR